MIANRRLEKCGKSWQLYDPSVASDYLICRLVQIKWQKASDFDKVIARNNEEKERRKRGRHFIMRVSPIIRQVWRVTLIVNAREVVNGFLREPKLDRTFTM